MGRSENSYLDFAENDYFFFRKAYDSGNKGSALAAIGQNICERYLKHTVAEYAQPETEEEYHKTEKALRTHNLQILMRYIHETMGLSIPEEMEEKLDRINGFYFTTRYPGDDCFIATEKDIDKANAAVESARRFTLKICKNMGPSEGHEI